MTLTVRTRAWAGIATAALAAAGALATPVAAQTDGGAGGADATVQALRAEAEAASSAYFAALSRYATLNREIAGLEAQLPTLRAEEAARLRAATARAAAAYEGAGSRELGAVITSGSVLTAARQTQWLKVLNARENKVLIELRRAGDRLRAQERTLRAEQQDAASALSTLQAHGQVLEARLGAAEARQLQVTAPSAPPAPAPTGAPSGGTPAPTPAAPPAPTTGYTPTPGPHPHHDDAFLVCTRERESGGNYRAYNPAGPYMGAYQFLQATWDGAANHIGRPSLIGVHPHQASPFDQDDVAWGLYQWQGAGPWGGHCP